MCKATVAVLAVALRFSTSAAAERSLFFEETARVGDPVVVEVDQLWVQ